MSSLDKFFIVFLATVIGVFLISQQAHAEVAKAVKLQVGTVIDPPTGVYNFGSSMTDSFTGTHLYGVQEDNQSGSVVTCKHSKTNIKVSNVTKNGFDIESSGGEVICKS